MYYEWNMLSAENCLISPSGKSWLRQLANISHISRKTMSQQDIEESLEENWDVEFGTASPVPIDWDTRNHQPDHLLGTASEEDL